MNVCHELKAVLWLPQRTASRSISRLFHDYNFINMEHNTPMNGVNNYTHDLIIPPGCEDYDVICTVRNPYTWLLSIWHWDNFYPGVAEKDRIPFEYYVENRSSDLEGIQTNILKTNIKYFIRYESITEDICKIPWYNYNSKKVNFILSNNNCKSEYLKRRSDNDITDFTKHYSKKELSIVNAKYSGLFNKLGYSVALETT